jgi:hypothetical protein
VPFWLLAWGETRIDSGLAALLQAGAPLFTALLATFFFRSERVDGARLAGVLVGFGGVALLVGAVPSGSLIGALAVVATGFCSRGLVSSRAGATEGCSGDDRARRRRSRPWSSCRSGSRRRRPHPSWKVIGSVFALGVVGLGVAYVIYFGLITGAGAWRAILVTYLVPPMALLARRSSTRVSANDRGPGADPVGVSLGTGVPAAAAAEPDAREEVRREETARERRHLPPVLLLAAIWGASYLFIRSACATPAGDADVVWLGSPSCRCSSSWP